MFIEIKFKRFVKYFQTMINESNARQLNEIESQNRYEVIFDKIQAFEKRKKQYNMVINKFFQYILECHKIYIEFLQNLYNEVSQQSQDSIFTFSDCTEVKNYFTNLKNFCLKSREKYQDNLATIQQIDYKFLMKSDGTVQYKYQFYLDTKPLYVSYNKKNKQLQKDVQFFKNKLQKAKQYEQPLKFYNQKEVSKELEQLEKIYKQISLKQKEIQYEDQVIKENQRQLRKTFDDLCGEFTDFINSTLRNVIKVCKILLPKQNMVVAVPGSELIDSEEFYDTKLIEKIESHNQQISYPLKHRKENFKQNFHDILQQKGIKGYLTNNSQQIKIQLLEDRYNLIKEDYIKDMNKMIKQKKLFRQYIKKHSTMFKDLNQKIKNAKAQIILYSYHNNIQNYKREFKQHFGKKATEIQNLIFLMVEELNEAIQKFENILKIKNNDYFKTFIEIEERQLSKAQKNIYNILKNHEAIKRKSDLEATVIYQNQYRQSCQTTFEKLQALFEVIQMNKKQRVKNYNQSVKKVNSYFAKTLFRYQQELYAQNLERFDSLQTINIEKQTFDIVKQDKTFDLLLSDIRKTQRQLKYNTPIPQNQYTKINKMLQQKNKRSLSKFKKPSNSGRKSSFCCGSSRVNNINKQFDEYQCSLLKKNTWRKGTLYINAQLLYFEGEKYILKENITLSIPMKQIKKSEVIQLTSQRQKSLLLQTTMGKITIKSKQATYIEQKLRKQNPNILRSEDQSLGKSLIKKLLSNDMQSSRLSHKGKNMKVYEIDIPKNFEESTKDDFHTISINQSFERIIKKYNQFPNFFGSDYKITSSIKKNNIYRINYEYLKEFPKIEVKQEIDINYEPKRQRQQEQNCIKINYLWKIKSSISECNSFMHSQKVIITINNQEAVLNIEQSPHWHWQKFVAITFYKSVQKMNGNIQQEIYKLTNRKLKMKYFLNNTDNSQLSEKREQQSADGIFHQIVISKQVSNLKNSIPYYQQKNILRIMHIE